MVTLSDVKVLEEDDEASPEEVCRALQRCINEGSAWRMQGSYGRSMMAAIESGDCMLGLVGTKDYWGNYIPSRSEVKEGTKGSRSYVVESHGEDWAQMLEAV